MLREKGRIMKKGKTGKAFLITLTLATCLAMLALLSGCMESTDSNNSSEQSQDANSSDAPESSTESYPKVNKVNFELVREGHQEYGVFTAEDTGGNEAWVYTTPLFDSAQLQRVSELGINRNHYYFVADGELICLDLEQGTEIWRNEDFQGAGTDAAWDEQGTIYVVGYLGPSLFIADANGKTIDRIKSFGDEYLWPYDITYNNGTVHIEFEGNGGRSLSYDVENHSVE